MIKIELTELFSDDITLKEAAKALRETGVALENLILAWCKLGRSAWKTGMYMPKKKLLRDASLVVELDDKIFQEPGYKVMEEKGMIRIADTGETVKSVLSDEKFEEFWKAYPFRDVNGRKVKVGKAQAKRRFNNIIVNEKTFAELMLATQNYSRLCNKFPKDCERFLKDGFWREYASDAELTENAKTAKRANIVTSADLDKLME